MVLKLAGASKSPGGLVKQELLNSTPRVFDSVGLDWSLKSCSSRRFPDDADAAGTGTIVWESLPYIFTNSPSKVKQNRGSGNQT